MRVLAIFLVLFIFFLPSGHCQSWQWARGAIGSGFATIATDVFGHIYAAGAFDSPTITFDGITLTNAGTDSTQDIFFVKYDTSGNVIWAKRIGGSGYDEAHHIATDAKGNVYFVGATASPTISFDTITLTYSGTSDEDIYLVKYDSSGHAIWAKNASGSGFSGDIHAESISVDALGNVYVAGDFATSTVTFGAFTLINSAGATMFLVKYSPSGDVTWAKAVEGGAAYDVSAAVDTMWHIYVTGTFNGSVSFGSSSLVGQGSNDIFLAKYDSSGNPIWAKDEGTPDAEYGNDVTTDIFGNAYVTGFFMGSSFPLGPDTLVNNYSPAYDYYVAKFDSSGNVLWARNSIGPGNADLSGIVVDNSGNVYSTGGFYGDSITFGSDIIHNSNPANEAIFVTKYVASGNNEWAIGPYGFANAIRGCITINNWGQVYETGSIFGPEFYIADSSFTGSYRGQYFIACLDTSLNPYALVPAIARSLVGLSAVPNPNTGSFILNISSPANEDATIVITNIIGEKVKELTTTTNTATEIQIDTPPGMYFISATTAHGSQSAKVAVW